VRSRSDGHEPRGAGVDREARCDALCAAARRVVYALARNAKSFAL
jgi:hypothetical protein